MRDLLRGTRRFLSGLRPVKVPDAPARASATSGPAMPPVAPG